MKKKNLIGCCILIANILLAQNFRVSNDIIKYDTLNIAKIIVTDNSYNITSIDGQKSYTFLESKGKLVNGETYFTYVITDLQTQKSNHLVLYDPTDMLGKRGTFIHNFTKRPFANEPHTFISEYGFNSGKIENLINKNPVDSQEEITKKNDSINTKLSSVLKKYDEDQLSITFDNKIKRTLNGSKIDIGKIERIAKPGEPLNYRVYLMIKNNLEFVGFYGRSGFVNTNFLAKDSKKEEKIQFDSQLMIKGDQIYRILPESGSTLPISKDPNARKIVALVYDRFKNNLEN